MSSSKFIEIARIAMKSIAEELHSQYKKQIIRQEGERFFLIDQITKDNKDKDISNKE